MNYLVNNKKHFTSSQIIIVGFLGVILTGTVMLMMPFATRDGTGATFADAIFTATSATCVTGLVVQNTVTYWSWFGQLMILIMIQIGGMGVVTMAVAIASVSGRKIGLMQRSTMQEAVSAHNVGGIVRMTSFIIKTTIMIEILGALVLFTVFYEDFGLVKGAWYAIFHSISAFCNAGFDLLGIKVSYASLTAYHGNPVINLTIITLIVVGGIGFLTWEDIKSQKWNFHKYRMQTKVILLVTGLLIVFPTLYFYFFEFTSDVWSGFSNGEKFLGALFQAVTPRTAGFNTVDLTLFSEPSQAFILLLMLIGGAPGSTAGGMKVTTAAVLILITLAVFQKKEDSHCFGRRIPRDTATYAVAILMLYMVLFFGGGFLISCVEKLPLLTCLFETASAIGTVGLSLGITPQLSQISRVVLILLMFIGRVGGLTLVFAAISPKGGNASRFPIGKITVG